MFSCVWKQTLGIQHDDNCIFASVATYIRAAIGIAYSLHPLALMLLHSCPKHPFVYVGRLSQDTTLALRVETLDGLIPCNANTQMEPPSFPYLPCIRNDRVFCVVAAARITVEPPTLGKRSMLRWQLMMVIAMRYHFQFLWHAFLFDVSVVQTSNRTIAKVCSFVYQSILFWYRNTQNSDAILYFDVLVWFMYVHVYVVTRVTYTSLFWLVVAIHWGEALFS